MLDELNGLPGHVLLVHAVVVLLPLTAGLLVAAVVSARLRRRIGVALPLLAAGCVALVPLTTHAGHWLELFATLGVRDRTSAALWAQRHLDDHSTTPGAHG